MRHLADLRAGGGRIDAGNQKALANAVPQQADRLFDALITTGQNDDRVALGAFGRAHGGDRICEPQKTAGKSPESNDAKKDETANKTAQATSPRQQALFCLSRGRLLLIMVRPTHKHSS
ncbi:hypothetical protein D3C87_1782990 [compost metagenome]